MSRRGAGTPSLFDGPRGWDIQRHNRKKRIQRLARKRKAGKSPRAIATACRTSLRQVQLDLSKAVEMGLDIESEGETVVGRDKRRQPATRPRKQGTATGLLDELAVIVVDGRKLVDKPTAPTIRRLAERVAATTTALKKFATDTCR